MEPLTGPLDFAIYDVRTPNGLTHVRVPKWPGGSWRGMPVPANVYHTVAELDEFHAEWVRTGRKRNWNELPGLIKKRNRHLERRRQARVLHSAAKPRRTAGRPPGMTTALYRHYDADDLLLYLGITADLLGAGLGTASGRPGRRSPPGRPWSGTRTGRTPRLPRSWQSGQRRPCSTINTTPPRRRPGWLPT